MTSRGLEVSTKSAKFDRQAFGRALAQDPAIASRLNALAAEVVKEAQGNLLTHGANVPATSVDTNPQPRVFRGGAKKPRPPQSAKIVASKVKVKDGTKPFNRQAPKYAKVGPTRVALVVSDSNDSTAWEFGLRGLPTTAFLAAAVTAVAGRYSWVTRR